MNSAEHSLPVEEPLRSKVRSELHAVTRCESFERSPQLQRLLRYLVEETLAGRGSRLKEYVIGTEVFGLGGWLLIFSFTATLVLFPSLVGTIPQVALKPMKGFLLLFWLASIAAGIVWLVRGGWHRRK